jgi:hypothetical protein
MATTKTTEAKAPAKKAPAAKAPPEQKADKPKKEHRFMRAFRVIADNPKSTPEAIAKKASLSVKSAGGCILAWNAAIQILGDKEVLAVDAAELAAELVTAKAA